MHKYTAVLRKECIQLMAFVIIIHFGCCFPKICTSLYFQSMTDTFCVDTEDEVEGKEAHAEMTEGPIFPGGCCRTKIGFSSLLDHFSRSFVQKTASRSGNSYRL